MYNYFKNIFAASSALGNAVLGRSRSLSISGQSHVKRGLWRKVVNKMFFWNADHCSGAFSGDVRSHLDMIKENVHLLDAAERFKIRHILSSLDPATENHPFQDDIETEAIAKDP